MHSSTHHSIPDLLEVIRHQEDLIKRLQWNSGLNMLNQAGGMAAIAALPEGYYTIVFCDIDRLKQLNVATGNHLKTNRYLAAGLQVRDGEIAFQLFGDEYVVILGGDADAAAFIARITRQLASQPLTFNERCALAQANGCRVENARLSATFSACTQVRKSDILVAIEECSVTVLAQKEARG